MTAFCGILGSAQSITETQIHQSLDSMPQRGGPRRDLHVLENFGLGVSWGNLSEGGGLFHSPDRSTWIALEGRILNAARLAEDHQASPEEGAAIIPLLYQRHGAEFLSKLEGNFSIAVWDGARRRVLLATDHIGTKPLFYTLQAGRLLVASELRGILSHPAHCSRASTRSPRPRSASSRTRASSTGRAT